VRERTNESINGLRSTFGTGGGLGGESLGEIRERVEEIRRSEGETVARVSLGDSAEGIVGDETLRGIGERRGGGAAFEDGGAKKLGGGAEFAAGGGREVEGTKGVAVGAKLNDGVD